jgi:predicted ATPase/class 3 adenylate cyclase
METRTHGTTSEPAARVRPAGTVTFLFTDIEGSTKRWDRHGREMQAALRRHDAFVRGAIEARGGFVFKTVGDAFCSVFSRAEDAALAAVSLQRAIRAADFSDVDGLFVRVALHTGTADERDDDYFGTTVNQVARLLATAHGEQILLTGPTASLLAARLPPEISLLDLGSQSLKDIDRPVHVHQLVSDGLRADFPPLRTSANKTGNLPLQLTSFVGRTDEVAEIGTLLEHNRLITLAGMGGVGKTRLALEVARAFVDRYPDGAWFVELAPLSDPGLASARVGEVFGMREQIGTVMNETWVAALDRKNALLVLDNCEHMVDAVAAVAGRILERCPTISIVATSREPLRLSGERVVRLAPLALPPPTTGAMPSIEELREAPAVRLFLERAANSDRSGALLRDDEGSRRSLVSICSRLDGIPLAIELAAARVNVLGLKNLADRLDDRFRLLSGGPRTALPRQQTLRALLDWSHDLLREPEQRVLRRLAVFAGGWTLDAAQAVCVDDDAAAGMEAISEWDVFDILSSLVEKSLVGAETSDTDTRYGLLETTRAYALERLTKSGEAERIAAAHARYVLGLAQSAARTSLATSPRAWQTAFEGELDNVRAALEWTIVAKNDVVLGATIVQALDFAFESLGLYFEGLGWGERALAALPEGDVPKIEGALALLVSKFHTYIGSPAGCVSAAERAVRIARELGKKAQLAYALALLAFGLYYLERREEGDVHAAESVALAREIGDPSLLAWVLCVKSWTVEPTDFATRRALLGESRALFDTLPGRFRVELALQALSEVEFVAGNYAAAMAFAREGSAPERRKGPSEGLAAWCLAAGAAAAFADGDIETARADAREALSYGRRRGSGRFVGASVGLLAGVAAVRGDATQAALLFGASEAQYVAIGRSRMLQEQFVFDRTLALLKEALDASELASLRERGRAMTVEQAVESALAL